MKRNTRPLGKLSDFVVEELYKLLRKYELLIGWDFKNRNQEYIQEFQKEFKAKVIPLIQSEQVRKKISYYMFESGKINFLWRQEYSDRDLALLDLKILNQAYYHLSATAVAGHKQPYVGMCLPELAESVESLRKVCNKPFTLTYEELVMINPHHDMRLFSTNKLEGYENFDKKNRAHNEYLFLTEHRHIEDKLLPIIIDLHLLRTALIDRDFSKGGNDFIKSGKESCLRFQKIFRNMAGLHHRLDRELFNQFRNYYSSMNILTDKGLIVWRGASGAYTGSIPMVHLLLGYSTSVDTVDLKYCLFLEDFLELFPTFQQKTIMEYIEPYKRNRNTINALLEDIKYGTIVRHADSKTYMLSNDELLYLEELHKEVRGINSALLHFRVHHLDLIRDKLPPGATGTGGEKSVDSFLQHRIDNSPR